MDKIKLNIVGDITRESKYYNRLLKIISNYRLSKKLSFIVMYRLIYYQNYILSVTSMSQ